MRTSIICLGNELRVDDGVGIHSGRVLEKLELPTGVALHFAPSGGLAVLDSVFDSSTLVLVDAFTTGGPPGTLVSVEHDATAPHDPLAVGWGHELPLATVLELAATLCPDRPPPRVRFLGLVAQDLDGFGMTLTPELQAALPALVCAVLRAIDADAALTARAREVTTAYVAGLGEYRPSVAAKP